MRTLVALVLRRVMVAGSGALGLVAVALPQAQARTDPEALALERSRVKLDERVARASDLLSREAVPPAATGERVAQWPNWPNYWSNWPNWRNFR